MSISPVREEQAIRKMIDRLVDAFADNYSADQVESRVGAVRQRFDSHPVRDFVPILVERIVRQELETEPRQSANIGPAVSAAPQSEVNVVTRPAATVNEQPQPTSKTPSVTREAPAATVSSPPNVDEPRPSATPRPSRTGISRVGGRRGLSILAIAVVAVAASAAVVAMNAGGGSEKPITTVRGVVGSEKQSFFDDPQVRKAFASKGLKVEVDSAGSRQIATSIDLKRYDFAFPSSAPAADRILHQQHVTGKYTPFSSPMAIATFQPIADLLAQAGVAKHGAVWTFDVARYLDLVGKGVRWDQLQNNNAYSVHQNILISTTDPRSSNSAVMYLAVMSYVANGDTIVNGPTAERKVMPTVSQLFLKQGYTDNTSEEPFSEYLSVGTGKAPLVWIYEAQFVDAAVRAQLKPGMVLMYPSPTVLSEHTLVPLNASGDRVGRLLSSDPELQRLAAEHGFRSNDPAQFAKVVADHSVPVAASLTDVVDPPSYDTLENLLSRIAKLYS